LVVYLYLKIQFFFPNASFLFQLLFLSNYHFGLEDEKKSVEFFTFLRIVKNEKSFIYHVFLSLIHFV
jgi:hypothetical protein